MTVFRAAGIAGVVLALATAAVPAAGAATVPAAGDAARPSAAAARSADATARAAAWAVQPTPNPLIRDGRMAAVSCTSPSACVTVGSRINSADVQVTLAETWNGTSWSIQQTPNPAGARETELAGVSCTSATSCIAVGDTFTPGSPNTPLAEAWNGTSWSIQQVPSPPDGGVFNRVSCASASVCVAVGGLAGPLHRLALAGVWNGTSWSVQQTPNPPGAGASELLGVSCTSPSRCTATGNYANTAAKTLTLAEVWNGTTWSRRKTPNPPSGGSLGGVSCTSASACTAVGSDASGESLAERWNGTAWSIQATPNVNGQPTRLGGVSCSSATLCTATGEYGNVAGPAAEQWNGTTWSVQQVPAPHARPGGDLADVSCTSASACTAVGSDSAALAEAWNGTSWSVQPITTPPGTISSKLTGVSCTSASVCVAVGNYPVDADNDSASLAEEWNGTSWSILPAPANPGAPTSFGGGTFLTGVSCISPSACTVVGYFINSSGGASTLAESWNGTTWTVQSAPDQPGDVENVLLGVSCTSATACSAVGYYRNQDTYPRRFTLAESWNGTSWSIEPTPDHDAVDHVLNAVSCTSASACTAVGSQGFDTLAESWNGTTWTVQPTPHPEQGQHMLQGVSCTSASACVAVGSAYDGTLAESWNGTSWSIQPTPGPETTTTAASAGVSCPTATACTAVWSTGYRTIAAGWNGTTWSLQQTAKPTGSTVHLLGSVSCPPGGGCTAVGDYRTSTGGFNLAEAMP